MNELIFQVGDLVYINFREYKVAGTGRAVDKCPIYRFERTRDDGEKVEVEYKLLDDKKTWLLKRFLTAAQDNIPSYAKIEKVNKSKNTEVVESKETFALFKESALKNDLERIKVIDKLIASGNEKDWYSNFEFWDDFEGIVECNSKSDVFEKEFVRLSNLRKIDLNGVIYRVPRPVLDVKEIKFNNKYWLYIDQKSLPMQFSWTNSSENIEYLRSGRIFKTKRDVELLITFLNALFSGK